MRRSHLGPFQVNARSCLTYTFLANGKNLQDLELLHTNETYLDARGAPRILDTTTVGGFLRRFGLDDIDTLRRVINRKRCRARSGSPPSSRSTLSSRPTARWCPLRAHAYHFENLGDLSSQ
jgi:hypothetical protein